MEQFFKNLHYDIVGNFKIFFSILLSPLIFIWLFILPLITIIYFIIFLVVTLLLFFWSLKFIFIIYIRNEQFTCKIKKKLSTNLFFLYFYDFFFIFSFYKSFDIFYNFIEKIVNFKEKKKLKFYEFIIIFVNISLKSFFKIITNIPYNVFCLNNSLTLIIYNIYKKNNFIYFFKKQFFMDFYYNLYYRYIKSIETIVLQNKIYRLNKVFFLNMKKFSFVDIFKSQNCKEISEIKSSMVELYKNTIYGTVSNTLPNNSIRCHRSQWFNLKNGDYISTNETTKEHTWLKIDNRWEKISTQLTSYGSKDPWKLVYMTPPAYNISYENINTENTEKIIKLYPKETGVSLEVINNLRNDNNSFENTGHSFIKVPDSYMYTNNEKGQLEVSNTFKTTGDFINLKRSEIPSFYTNIYDNICYIISKNPEVFDNLDPLEQEFLLKIVSKDYLHENDVEKFKKLINSKFDAKVSDNFFYDFYD